MRLEGAPIGGIDPTAVIGRPPQHRDFRALPEVASQMFPFGRNLGRPPQSGGVTPAQVPGVLIHPEALVEKLVQVDAATTGTTEVRAQAWIMAGCHIAHDCIVGERCELAAGVILCGHVEIGDDVRVGVGAMFRSFVKVGACARVGMGAVVTKDVGEHECWAGNPARKLYDLCWECGQRVHLGDCWQAQEAVAVHHEITAEDWVTRVPEQVCWRAPNAHPPHAWVQEDVGGRRLWCPGVAGRTMY